MSGNRNVENDESHVGALFNIGLAMESLGRLSEADSFYKAVLREDPDHVLAHRQLGVSAVKKGLYEKATIYFQAALRLRPGDPALKEALSKASEQWGTVQKKLDHKVH